MGAGGESAMIAFDQTTGRRWRPLEPQAKTADPEQDQRRRDHRGRWQRGVSGNRAGRPKGSRNRWRRADLGRPHAWTAGEWKLHFVRVMKTADGDSGERKAAAYAECQGLWRILNRPKAQLGMCAPL